MRAFVVALERTPMFPTYWRSFQPRHNTTVLLSLKNFNGGDIIVKTKLLKVGFTTAFIVFIGGGLLFSTITMIDATQTDKPVCIEQPRIGCTILEKQETPCPKPIISPCTREVEK